MNTVNHSNINFSAYRNLSFSYLLSKEKPSKGTVLLLDGLPSNPESKNALMKKFIDNHFDVFFPRYEGTFESKGEFLKRNPSDAIEEFISKLKNGIDLLDNQQYASSRIFLLGSSFGGAVALDIANRNIVRGVCAVSPVISFRKINKINTLESYLKTQYKNEYRFNSEDWQKLIQDKLWDLSIQNKDKNSDILIIAGKEDDQINVNDIIGFKENKDMDLSIYDTGHISLSKITEPMLSEILSFYTASD